MKILFAIVFVVVSFKAVAQHSDLREYGLNGKIKKVITVNYLDFEWKDESSWTADTSRWISIIHISFNETGYVTEVQAQTRVPALADTTIHFLIKYQYKDGKKTGVIYNGGEVGGYERIEWIGPRAYKTYNYDEDYRLLWEATSWLNTRFRDSAGEFHDLNGDSLIFSQRYENVFDEEGYLTATRKTDSKGLNTTDHYIVPLKDINKNPLSIHYRREIDGVPYRIAIRTYEYYHSPEPYLQR